MKYTEVEERITGILTEAATELHPSLRESPERIALQIPRNETFGDLSSNVAIQLSRRLRQPPKVVAGRLIERIRGRLESAGLTRSVRTVEEQGGFINLRFHDDFFYDLAHEIIGAGESFGRSRKGQGKKVLIEFVSANPTGPLTVAHGRQAAIGDSLGNILSFCGFSVEREYYVNDKGRQMSLLGASLRARYLEGLGIPGELPEDGYRGEYIRDIAARVKEEKEDGRVAFSDGDLSFFEDFACAALLAMIREDLTAFGVTFTSWFSQRELEGRGEVGEVLTRLKREGVAYEKEGALWLASSRYGDEKDRVLVKSTGDFTYLAPDLAYHFDKYRREFDSLINLWGPDHHGYIPRLKGGIAALGCNAEALSVLIVQLVTLLKDGEPLSMSTRAGQFITLKELIDEVGRDAARFFYLLRKRDSHLEFDLAVAKRHSLDNPVYYVQYAHARIANIFGHGVDKGVSFAQEISLAQLQQPEERTLLRLLYQFPLVVSQAADALEPYRIVAYLIELAGSFHSFYAKHRVVTDDKKLTEARLFLVRCVQIVIGNGLRLLGVSCPEKM